MSKRSTLIDNIMTALDGKTIAQLEAVLSTLPTADNGDEEAAPVNAKPKRGRPAKADKTEAKPGRKPRAAKEEAPAAKRGRPAKADKVEKPAKPAKPAPVDEDEEFDLEGAMDEVKYLQVDPTAYCKAQGARSGSAKLECLVALIEKAQSKSARHLAKLLATAEKKGIKVTFGRGKSDDDIRAMRIAAQLIAAGVSV